MLSILPSQTIQAAEPGQLPIFLVLATDKEGTGEQIVFTAFCVEDTYGTGKAYLVTGYIVDELFKQGYHVTVNQENYSSNVTNVYTDGYVTYVEVDDPEGLQSMYETLKMGQAYEYTEDVLVAYWGPNQNGTFAISTMKINCSTYQTNDIYLLANNIATQDFLCGAGIIKAPAEVVGIMVPNGDTMAIQDLTRTQFVESAAIGDGTAKVVR